MGVREIREWRRRLYQQCRKGGLRHDDAEDVVQDVLVACHTRVVGLAVDHRARYLHKACGHAIARRRRRANAEALLVADFDIPVQEPPAPGNGQREHILLHCDGGIRAAEATCLLDQLFSLLPAGRREQTRRLLLRRAAGETPADIAKSLGVPDATVRTQVRRGLAQLREVAGTTAAPAADDRFRRSARRRQLKDYPSPEAHRARLETALDPGPADCLRAFAAPRPRLEGNEDASRQ